MEMKFNRMFLVWNFYKNKFEVEYPEVNESDIEDAICYWNEFKENAIENYLLKNGCNKNVVDALNVLNGVRKPYSPIEKIVKDIQLSYLRNKDDFYKEHDMLIKNEDINKIREKYQNILKEDIFCTKTFEKFNKLAKNNLEYQLKMMK